MRVSRTYGCGRLFGRRRVAGHLRISPGTLGSSKTALMMDGTRAPVFAAAAASASQKTVGYQP